MKMHLAQRLKVHISGQESANGTNPDLETGAVPSSFYCLIHWFLRRLQPPWPHLPLQQQGAVSGLQATGRDCESTTTGQNVAEGFRTIHGRGNRVEEKRGQKEH